MTFNRLQSDTRTWHRTSSRWAAWFAAAGLAMVITPASGALPDQIFASEFVTALIIDGKVGYPAPLANARVEMQVGSRVAVGYSAGDGTFHVGIELPQIDPAAIIELVAHGNAPQAHLVWASTLGPAADVLALADANRHVGFDRDPFVHLNPRTTVVAAALRAANGGQPIADAASYFSATRNRQVLTDGLVNAIALVARGATILPAGATDTFSAATVFAQAQQLYASEEALYQADYDCTTTPLTAWCTVATTLPTDPNIIPPQTLTQGQLLSLATPFDTSTFADWGFRLNGDHVDVIGMEAQAIHAPFAMAADDSYRLTRAGGAAFLAYENYPFDPDTNAQIHEHIELMEIRIRPTMGPARQIELAIAQDYRYSYPDNPGHAPRYVVGRMSLPGIVSGTPLRSELAIRIPTMANHSYVLPAVLPNPELAYDVHAFGSTSGTAARFGKAFTFTQSVNSPEVTIDYPGVHSEIEFINEEEPGIWRVRAHATTSAGESLASGLLLPVDAGAAWTTANVPGTDISLINGHICAGPYGNLDQYTVYPVCFPLFGFVFASGGTVQRYGQPPTPYGTWNLLTGANAGRLVLQTTTGSQRRGWQLIHQSGADYWVLENSLTGNPAPAVTFEPTSRLVRYQRR